MQQAKSPAIYAGLFCIFPDPDCTAHDGISNASSCAARTGRNTNQILAGRSILE
jgi:hypothetical protein